MKTVGQMVLPVGDQKVPHPPRPAHHRYHGFKKEKTDFVIHLLMAPLARWGGAAVLGSPSRTGSWVRPRPARTGLTMLRAGHRGVVGTPGPMMVELYVSKGKSQRNEPH